MIGDIVLPKMSRQLSGIEISEAIEVCKAIRFLVENRENYVNEHAVDPLFAFPDSNWDASTDGQTVYKSALERMIALDCGVLSSEELRSNSHQDESADDLYLNSNESIYIYRKLSNGLGPELLNTFRLYVQVFSGYSLLSMDRTSVKLVEHHQNQGTLDLVVEKVLKHPTKRQLLDRWHALISGIPERFVFTPPLMLGECGYEDSIGRIVSIDSIMYQERINILYEAGILNHLDMMVEEKGELRILEIGGGWGALASWFKKTFSRMQYTILDLPESLIFSSLYLTLTQPTVPFSFNTKAPTHGFSFIPNYAAYEIEGEFDLVINTLSMSEMSSFQVEKYCELIKDKWLARNAIFFEQNYDGRNSGLIFPYPIIEKYFNHKLQAKPSTVPNIQNGLPTIWSKEQLSLIQQNPRSLLYGPIKQIGTFGQYHLFEIGKSNIAIHSAVGNLNPYLLPLMDLAPAIFHSDNIVTLVAKCSNWITS